MIGTYASPKPKVRVKLMDGFCYSCAEGVEVVHLESKGQYRCTLCGGLETKVG